MRVGPYKLILCIFCPDIHEYSIGYGLVTVIWGGGGGGGGTSDTLSPGLNA